jgi:segregation and condensation protein A
VYSIKLQQFEGPLDLLLRLIEEQELDISQVSLATVTEQFITELERAESLSSEELSDFLVVAAKLLYIKSKILIPRVDEEEEDAGLDLERQLKIYKAYLDASHDIQRALTKRRVLYLREATLPTERMFIPPVRVTSNMLHDIFSSVIAGIAPIVMVNERVMSKTINIREKIDEIRTLLMTKPNMKFDALLESVTNRTELIVTFLAMLELVKLRSIVLVQDEIFTDIHIQSVNDNSESPL